MVTVAAGQSGWLAVASGRDEVAPWHSSDGMTWTTMSAPPGVDRARADDGTVLVAVGRDRLLLQVGNTLWTGSPP